MSSSLKYFKDEDETPAHTRVLVRFENGYHLAYISVRKLGKVFVVKDIEAFIRKQQLGPDALAIDFEIFQAILGNRRSSIKTTMMDQASLAGLGNIYTDGILFQSGIRPTQKCNQIATKEWRRGFRAMKQFSVLRSGNGPNQTAFQTPI